ncbi:MinD/ParA family protein [Nitrosophilus kaiyonis]|uniref:MinD/ParA family protein n=1 Tax=Nitrosophilus kaiyonis TaxID=2930200 RepID=UPI0024935C9A|nr:MinD/ParA family protein [Nitrosophilus kaiyonis]
MEDQAKGLRDLINKNKILQNSKFITIASGKGGVGKTNFSVNFAYSLANFFKKRVLLIDADIGMANIHILLNTDPSKTLKNLFNGENIENILVNRYGFDALLGFSGIDSISQMDEFSISSLINSLEEISYRYDYIIIDTGAGIDDKIASFLRASSRSYIITTPEPTALMDAYALIKSIYNIYGYNNFKIVINMAKSKEEAFNTFNKLKISANKFLGIDLEMIGYLPLTQNLKKCVKKKEIITKLFPNDPFSLEMKKISAIEAEEPMDKQNINFWEKVFDFLGQKRKK